MQLHRWAVALVFVPVAAAATVTLTPSNFGFYNQAGTGSAGNHAIGWYGGANEEIRQYLIFDRSAINGAITGATLRLQDPQTGFASPNPQETWALFDVNVPLAGLAAGNGGVSAFQDLGNGVSLGSLAVSAANAHQIIPLALDANGLSYLNGQSGVFAIGGALTTLAKTNGVSERLFNNGTGPALVRELELTYDASGADGVPEPAAVVLLGGGLLVICWRRRNSWSPAASASIKVVRCLPNG